MNPDNKDKATGASAPSGSSGALTPKPGVSAPTDAQGTYEIEVIGGMIFSRLFLLFTRPPPHQHFLRIQTPGVTPYRPKKCYKAPNVIELKIKT